ncbi:MAG: type II toxin-antitoxin system RelE/ParE family toxin [Paracoccaceae bacterium]|nr:type II toxin-antitoxin system RelE/ParE family toxin [Paracoccaceae bacterium]
MTRQFLAQTKRFGLSEEEVIAVVNRLSNNPLEGNVISGTGGARKLRHASPGGGKSGGYRTIHYFAATDVPVFLLAVYGKGTKANLTKSERNALANLLPRIAEEYRAN